MASCIFELLEILSAAQNDLPFQGEKHRRSWCFRKLILDNVCYFKIPYYYGTKKSKIGNPNGRPKGPPNKFNASIKGFLMNLLRRNLE